MRYFTARLQQASDEYMYRIYMTDAVFYYARGKTTAKRYAEKLQHTGGQKDDRTGDEVAADLINRMGLKVV